MFFDLANLMPAATSTMEVALTVYTGWSPIEQVPIDCTVKLPEGQLSVGRSAMVHGFPAVALIGGHEPVG